MIYFSKLIWDTFRIDTVSLIPHSSHEPLHASVLLEYSYKRKHDGAEWGHLWLFLKNLLRAFRDPGPPMEQTPAGEIFLLAMSKNQEHSLHPIERELSKQTAARLMCREQLKRLRAWGFLFSIPFFPCLLWRWVTSTGYARRSYRWSMDQFWLNYGLYLVARRWLRRSCPKAIVVANDHSQISCVLVAAAKAEGITTYYVQHACVTYSFPPLQTDFALLDGRDAVKKYDQAGSSKTQVYTVGITKFDDYIDAIRTRSGLHQVGVCFNKADETGRSIELLDQLSKASQELEFRVVVRPHPRMLEDSLTMIRQRCNELGIDWSDPLKEPPFDFLCAQDVVLCGMSAIALEAALVNVVPVNFVLSDDFTDWYGFAEQGLCRSTDDFNELKAWLAEIKTGSATPIRSLAQHYSATVDSHWDGRSSELAANLILWKSAGYEAVPVQRITTERLDAYEVAP